MPLKVISKRITAQELGITELSQLLPGASACFMKDGIGIIGFGQAEILKAKGPNRILELNQSWQALVNSAEVTDQANLLGSGLIAFGAITFAAESEAESVLVIPSAVIGFYGEHYFVSTFNLDNFQPEITTPTKTSLSFSSGDISAEQFSSNVAQALELINQQRISKIVLARDLVASAKDFEAGSALYRLQNNYPTCYSYLVDGMLGASPELLVSVQQSKVSARVLAGTAGRGTDVEVDQAIGQALSHSQKNLHEHKYAIESLVASLEEHCSNIEASEIPFSLVLPNLWHLATDVTAELKTETTSLELLNSLHPSAAVAGTAKQEALKLIQEIEQTDRGRYAGPIGWLSANGDGIWAIALRGAQYKENQLTAFAGCGIVQESNPESELAETNLKFKAVLENL
jgi:menaquinone-specific isochorismate synthase